MKQIPSSTLQSSQATIYWDSLHMIDGAKPEIEGENQNIDGVKYQVVE